MKSTQIDFPLELESHGQKSCESMAGHLYRAAGEPRGVLQVLIHGNTYDHQYWDVGLFADQSYSYAHYMTSRGYDILALDLPGTGDSSRPDGDLVSLAWVAEAIASAVQAMRVPEGPMAGLPGSVALVGHSLGTIVSVYAQARWQVADLLVSTGTGYYPGGGVSSFGPGVRETALSTPYIRLPPDERAKAFYHPPTADREVIDFDNRVLRTEMPRRLWLDCLDIRADLSRCGVAEVKCPVLIQLGEHDQVLLGRYLDEERELWTGSSDVTTYHVDDMGHCFNLHENHEDSWDSIDEFLRSKS